MRVRQQRVSPRRSLLLGAVAAVALLSAAPTAMADEHKDEAVRTSVTCAAEPS